MRPAFLRFAALLFAFAFASKIPAGAAERALEIYWIDVEGGGATLIVTPAGESVLIDAGNPFERDSGGGQSVNLDGGSSPQCGACHKARRKDET